MSGLFESCLSPFQVGIRKVLFNNQEEEAALVAQQTLIT
jgi:hypothetical protein